MRFYQGKHVLIGLAAITAFLIGGIICPFSVVPSSPAVEDGARGEGKPTAACVCADLLSPRKSPGGGAKACAPEATVETRHEVHAPAVREPEAGVPEPAPAQAEPAEKPLEPVEEGQPRISAVDPGLPAPTNFSAQFYYSGNRRVVLSWTGVSHPRLLGYWLLRWSGGDFNPMLGIFRELAVLDPSLAPAVQDLEAQFSRLNQLGWTYTERGAVLDDTERDMDILLAALVRTPGASGLVERTVALADAYSTTNTSYTDTSFSGNTYYIYIAAAAYDNGDTSPASNCGGVFTVANVGGPAIPAGFIATAYDPGVALEWNRNSEADLAGYNVYLVQGNQEILLNPTLIASGTEYFHMAGVAGATYRIRAYDVFGNRSQRASAVSVLAPATVYGADDPAWQYTGSWAREDYGNEPNGRGCAWAIGPTAPGLKTPLVKSWGKLPSSWASRVGGYASTPPAISPAAAWTSMSMTSRGAPSISTTTAVTIPAPMDRAPTCRRYGSRCRSRSPGSRRGRTP